MSGSMLGIRDATVEGVNEYVRQLKEDENAASSRFSLIAFDTVFERWISDSPIAECPYVGEEYAPRGMTALHDAIATMVTDLSQRVKEGEKCLVVVLTDGYENASREYGGEPGRLLLADMVRSREDTGEWSFVYLGANDYDVKKTAVDMGFNSGSTVAYSASSGSVAAATRSVARATATYTANAMASPDNGFIGGSGEDEDVRDGDDVTGGV
jgi:hypothetical protein